MAGSHAEADDAVQETWLRLARTDPEQIENVGGLLTTVVGRVCLDRLRFRRSRRGDFIDTPPPDEFGMAPDEDDPASQALLAESVGAALWVVLDRLGPAERVAFVLHDVFAVPFDEVGPILGRSPEAARQLASRARRRLQGSAATADVDLVRQRDLVNGFLRAARGGDFEALVRTLDPDVELRVDADAVRMGSLRATRGAAAVASMLSGGAQHARLAIVGGLTALVWAPAGKTRGVIEFTISDDKIVAINVTG